MTTNILTNMTTDTPTNMPTNVANTISDQDIISQINSIEEIVGRENIIYLEDIKQYIRKPNTENENNPKGIEKSNKVYKYYLHLLSIGWYYTNSQNKLVFEQYGGTLPCYICDKKTPYQDTKFCLTIPHKNFFKECNNHKIKNICNTFIMCSDCASSGICITPPKCYKDVKKHMSKKKKSYFLNKKIEERLISDTIFIKEHIIKLKMGLAKLKREYKKLKDNEETEKAKNQKLAIYKNKSKALLKELREYKTQHQQEIDEMRNNIIIKVDTTVQKLICNQTKMDDKYKKLLSTIKAGTNEVELISQTKVLGPNPCPICYNNERNMAFIPCGHTVCKKCSNTLMNQDGNIEKCPICRKTIIDTLYIYTD